MYAGQQMAEFNIFPGRNRDIQRLAAAFSSVSCNYIRIVHVPDRQAGKYAQL
jgi:hypothetical protein